jgi:hypothetical protein
MDVIKFLFRCWYYFRLGYGTYLTFVIGFVSTVTTVYYLLIKNVPVLLNLFSSFTNFVIIGAVLLIPTGVLFGWFHMKRTLAYSSEVDISIEANPYYYKLSPGCASEVQYPAYLSMIKMLKRIEEKEDLLTPKEKAEIEDLERKLETLIKGGMVGTPRRRL